MGQVYVEIDASVVNNGIMLLEASGGGQEGVTSWINWNSEGYMGIGWFWRETPITSWWESNYNNPAYVKGDYTSDEQGLSDWIASERIENLTDALGNWDNDAKNDFLKSHVDVFLNCVF